MECQYCHSTHRKFYCVRCLKDKLQTHRYELGPILFECDKAIEQSEQHVASATRIRALRAEKHRRAANIAKSSVERERIKADNNELKLRIEQLRQEIEQRRVKLDENERQRRSQKTPAEWERELQQYRKRSQKMYRMVILARRILVQEITLLFDFKASEPTSPPIHEQSSFMDVPFLPNRQRSDDLYICGVTLPSRTIDIAKYPKEELNAAIGLVVHMLGLIVGYLGVKLPFGLFYRGIHPYARSSLPRPVRSSKMPLFLDDENFRRFVIGVAMLNYDIAYLCHTQRVDIPLSQIANTFQNLMQCCQSPKLGIHSHATAQGGLSSLDFSLEFHHVLRATAMRFKSGPPIRADVTRGTTLSERHAAEGWLYYDGLDDDSEEENDDWNEEGDNGEHWNLVDVMPSMGREQGTESLFQLGAPVIPGVLSTLNPNQQDASKRKYKS